MNPITHEQQDRVHRLLNTPGLDVFDVVHRSGVDLATVLAIRDGSYLPPSPPHRS